MLMQYQQLSNAKPSELQLLFASFCNQIISDVRSNKLPMREGCYQIAGTMFIPAINDHQELLAIALLAGELELPDHHLSSSREHLWKQLCDYVDQLTASS